MGCMHQPRTQVGLVLRVALAVILQAYDLVGRRMGTANCSTFGSAPPVCTILIEIVAQMQNEIDVGIVGNNFIRVKESEWIV